jgi:hypothetical protein
MQFVDFLDRISYLEDFKFIYFHVPNEIANNKNPIFGNLLKKIGKKNGVADYIFLWENGCACLEFKTAKGKQSENQLIFQKKCDDLKIPYEIARSLEDGVKFLNKLGLVKTKLD